MNRATRARLARAERDSIPDSEIDLSGMDWEQRLIRAIDRYGLGNLIRQANEEAEAEKQAEAAERAAAGVKEPTEPEPVAETAAVLPEVAPKVAPPAPKPEPSPEPAPRQWWEEMCRWRVRGRDEVYCDEPELDQWEL